eukprot:2651244-Pleurochrysis_carterae.AAC.1
MTDHTAPNCEPCPSRCLLRAAPKPRAVLQWIRVRVSGEGPSRVKRRKSARSRSTTAASDGEPL